MPPSDALATHASAAGAPSPLERPPLVALPAEADAEQGIDGRWDLVAIVESGGPSSRLAAAAGGALDELAQTTSHFSADAARSSQSVAQISTEIEGLRTELDQLAERAGSLLSSSKDGEAMARESAELTAELLRQTDHGLAVIGRVIEGLDELSSRTEQVAELVDGLARNELNDISSFSSVIDGVANQTKLLALNAAIEAARAGDHGRGFAVVADEVGRLATETAAQTAQIAQTIDRTQRQMGAAQVAAGDARKRAAEGASNAGEGRLALEQVTELTGSASERSGRIAQIAGQQLADATAVNGGIRAIAASGARIEDHAHVVAGHQASLARGTEEALRVMARFRTSGSISHLHSRSQQLARELREVFEGAIARRELTLEQVLAQRYEEVKGPLIERLADLFDVSRVPPEGFDPPKYLTAYDAVGPRLTERLDALLDSEPMLALAGLTDINGYSPASATRFQHDWTGDRATDLAYNRAKRFLLDSVAVMRAARTGLGVDLPPGPIPRSQMRAAGADLAEPPPAKQGFLLQTYVRDTGAVMTAISVPIYVCGERYGAATIGWDPEMLQDA